MDQINSAKELVLNSHDRDNLQAAGRKVAELSAQSVQSLPSFEQKRWGQAVNDLRQLYTAKEAQLVSRRFKFEGKPIPKQKKGDTEALHQPSTKTEEKEQSYQLTRSTELEDGTNFTHIRDKRLDISDRQHVRLENIYNSTVTLSSVSSVSVQGAEYSLLRIDSTGPVFIHDARKSVICIRSHQARLHNLHECVIVAERIGRNRIVIENCDDLRLVGEVAVDDFNWPTSALNPHYLKYTPEEGFWARIKEGKLPRGMKE